MKNLNKIRGKRMTDLESKLFLFLENIKAEERVDIFLSMMEQNNENNKTTSNRKDECYKNPNNI